MSAYVRAKIGGNRGRIGKIGGKKEGKSVSTQVASSYSQQSHRATEIQRRDTEQLRYRATHSAHAIEQAISS
jgi:hypothetical protein